MSLPPRSCALSCTLLLACTLLACKTNESPHDEVQSPDSNPTPVIVEPEPESQPPAVEAPLRYPGELPGYEFHATAPWRELVPLESTLADVRRVLGEPSEARDLAHYVAPYPGDDAAIQPVLTYEISLEWTLLVYLVKSNLSVSHKFPAQVQDKLLSIDLVPKSPRSFGNVRFPEQWKSHKVRAADAGWLTFQDGSGLEYQVYTTKTPHGDEGFGDLNRVSYGPSDTQLEKLGVKK